LLYTIVQERIAIIYFCNSIILSIFLGRST